MLAQQIPYTANYIEVQGFAISKLTSIGNSFLALSLSVSSSPLRRWTGSITKALNNVFTAFDSYILWPG